MAAAPPQSDDDAKASGALSARAPRRRGPVRRLRAWLRRQGRQSVEALRERDGLAWAWAAVLLLALFSYLLDLGSGSIWNGDDARFAWETQRLAARDVVLGEAARVLPAPTGAPLALWQFMTAVQLFGSGDAALRLLPALSGLACSCPARAYTRRMSWSPWRPARGCASPMTASRRRRWPACPGRSARSCTATWGGACWR